MLLDDGEKRANIGTVRQANRAISACLGPARLFPTLSAFSLPQAEARTPFASLIGAHRRNRVKGEITLSFLFVCLQTVSFFFFVFFRLFRLLPTLLAPRTVGADTTMHTARENAPKTRGKHPKTRVEKTPKKTREKRDGRQARGKNRRRCDGSKGRRLRVAKEKRDRPRYHAASRPLCLVAYAFCLAAISFFFLPRFFFFPSTTTKRTSAVASQRHTPPPRKRIRTLIRDFFSFFPFFPFFLLPFSRMPFDSLSLLFSFTRPKTL